MKLARYSATLLFLLLIGESCFGADAPRSTFHGYVIDSACAFTKGLHRPISASCARQCAQAGSPLVILSDAGDIYWPISEKTPAEGQNEKLMPFAGKKVTVSGHIYSRDGSKAIAIDKIE